ALVSRGAKLLADDTLPIEPGLPATILPGVHRVRLWHDTVARLGAQSAGLEGSKHLVESFEEARVERRRVPIDAAYVLTPVRIGPMDPAAHRQRLTPLDSAMALIRYAKLAPLLGKSE